MKLPQFFLLLLLSSSSVLNAQSTPDPSAALEVRSTTQGFLPPRMTTAQRDAISSPAEGLFIYNTSTQKNNVYKDTRWYTLDDPTAFNTTLNLSAAGHLLDSGSLTLKWPNAVHVQDNYAYVTSFGEHGLQIIDISDPTTPVGVGQLVDDGSLGLFSPQSVFVQNNYAYVGSNFDGIQVVDVSDPANPVGVGQLADSGSLALEGVFSVFVQGNYAYAASRGDNGLQIVDVSDPTNPVGVGQLIDTGSLALGGALSVYIQGLYAFVTSTEGFQIIDISNPTNPIGVGQLFDDSSLLLGGGINDVFVQGNYAYVVSDADNGLQVIDISNRTNPVGVGQLAHSGSLLLNSARSVFVQGNYAYVASNASNALQVIDISDPTNPVGVDQLVTSGSAYLNGPYAVYVQGDHAYLVSNSSSALQVVALGSANELNHLEVGGLKTSSLEVVNHAQLNNFLDIKGGMSVGASANFARNLYVGNGLSVDGSIRFEDFTGGSLQADASGNLSVSSDERLKILEGEFTTGLAALLEVEPIRYRWNELSGLDQKSTYVGFSAQNVQAVIPEAVGQDPRGYLTLNDRSIIAALVNAIKELNTEREKLEEENESLKAPLEALTKRVALLKVSQ